MLKRQKPHFESIAASAKSKLTKTFLIATDSIFIYITWNITTGQHN